LYSKDLLVIGDDLRIDGMTLKGIIELIATCDIKTFPSLTSKVKFKYMDIVDKKQKK
jgi:hypothetical protein